MGSGVCRRQRSTSWRAAARGKPGARATTATSGTAADIRPWIPLSDINLVYHAPHRSNLPSCFYDIHSVLDSSFFASSLPCDLVKTYNMLYMFFFFIKRQHMAAAGAQPIMSALIPCHDHRLINGIIHARTHARTHARPKLRYVAISVKLH